MSIISTSKVIIPAVGSLDSNIAIIGEAPGSKEKMLRQPFVGEAGQLLNECLSKAGIVRARCYITNVIKEQPYRNNIKEFIDLNSRKQDFHRSPEYYKYVELLKAELEQCKANVFVAVGAVALFALTGLKGITKWRGSILESTLLPGRKVIPIIHPAAALRTYIWRHLIVNDLQRVNEESYFPEISLPVRNLKVAPSFVEVMDYLATIKNNYKRVAFDIEVYNLEVSCISFAIENYSAISIPFISGGNDYFNPDQELQIWKMIAFILEDELIMKEAQNAVFDCSFLFTKYGIRTYPVEDTMIAQGIAYPDFPKSLAHITTTYTKEPYYKDDVKFQSGRVIGKDKTFWIYNAKDSAVVHEALPKIMRDIKLLGNDHIFKIQNALIEPCVFMGVHGIKMDVEGMAQESKKCEIEIEKLKDEIAQMSDNRITNPNSTKQLKDYFYIYKEEKVIRKRTAARTITTDEEALKILYRRGHKVANKILELRKLVKFNSTYLQVKLDDDNRLRCFFNPIGTVQGRLSSSATLFGTGTNLQNQPKKARQFMIADDGYMMYELDLSQAENRIVAYIAPEWNMIEAFEDGRDIHSQTAALLFGKKLEDVSNEPGSSPLGNGEKSERYWGKTANHALNYNMGWLTFSKSYEIPASEAKMLRNRYYSIYPGVSQYHRWVREELSNSRSLVNVRGRKRVFLDRWGEALFRQAFNFIPQSTVADIMNEWGVNFVYYRNDLFPELILLNQVHDSLLFELPINIGWKRHAEILIRIRDSLQQPLEYKGRTWSIPIGMKMGLNWGDMVEKDMSDSIDELSNILEAVYNEKT